MARRSGHKALLALTLVAALLSVMTLGTAHAYLHRGDHAAAVSDCATCHAVKTGSTAVAGPVASPLPVCEIPEIAAVPQAAAPLTRAHASIASRAPPAA